MKIRVYFLILLVTLLIPTVLLTSCSKKVEEDDGIIRISFAFWGTPEEKQIVTNAVNKWQEAHPNVKVELEHTPAGGYVQKILTRIAGRVPPDIFAIRVDQFVNFAKKNVLLNLTPFIDNDPEFNIRRYFPKVVENFSYNGIYAIPRDTAPFACVFYNKDVFDKHGVEYPTDDWTWDDFLEKAKALSYVDEKGRKHYGYYGWAWQNFVYGNGGGLVDDVKNPTRTILDTPESIEGLQYYADLINVHGVMPTPVALANAGMGVDMMFADGNIAMFQSGIWETPSLLKYDNLRWDVVMFPKNKDGVRSFGTGGSAYGIIKSTKHPQEAWEVLKMLAGPVGQTELAKRGLAQPAIREIAESADWAGNALPPKNKGMLNEAVNHVVYDPFHDKWTEIQAKYIIPQLELLFNGKQDAETTVSNFVGDVNAQLQKL